MKALAKTEPRQADRQNRLWWRRLGVGKVRSIQVPALLCYTALLQVLVYTKTMTCQVPGARCPVPVGHRQAAGRSGRAGRAGGRWQAAGGRPGSWPGYRLWQDPGNSTGRDSTC